MSRFAALITVPHTGTQFFRQLLIGHGFEQVGLEAIDQPGKIRGPGRFVLMHVTPDALNWAKQHRNQICLVTTCRDSSAVDRSWQNRGKDMDTLQRYRKRWTQLCELGPCIVSVDAPDRDQRLDNLGKYLGVQFETDWTPVNEWKG